MPKLPSLSHAPETSAKVLLIYPPGSYVDMPTLGLACLQGYLKANNVPHVSLWDANVAFLDYLLTPERLTEQGTRIRSGAAPYGSPDELARHRLVLPHVRDAIEDVREIYRDSKRYYDVRSFNRASRLVQLALSILSTDPDPLFYAYNS